MGTNRLTLSFVLCIATLGAHPAFVYTNNNGSVNSVSAFSVAPNGALTPVAGSPFPTGGSGSIRFSPATQIASTFAKNFLYVANIGSQTISAFSIDTTSGRLTTVPGSPFPAGINGMGSMAVTPDDNFLLFIASGGQQVAVNRIGRNGAPTPVPGSPFTTPLAASTAGTATPKVTPDGAFLALASIVDIGAGVVTMLHIGSDGALVPVPGSANAGEAIGIDCNCASSHLYVSSHLSSFGHLVPQAAAGFNIASNGTLSPLADSPFFGPGTNYQTVLLSADDRTLFVADQGSSAIVGFHVASKGALKGIHGSPFPAGISPGSMATNQAGTFLYSADLATRSVNAFTVARNGALAPVPGSPFHAGVSDAGPLALTVFPPKNCCLEPDLDEHSATPDVLWPPDSKLVEVAIDYTVTGSCPNRCVMTVSSNEPPSGVANGTTSDDWKVIDAHHVLLRAEREGKSNDRVYAIAITCTNDTNGLSSSRTVTVRVPHDEGH